MTGNANELLQDEKEIKEKLAKITLKVWTDKEFASLLASDPKRALEVAGVDFGPHLQPKFHVDQANVRNFVIPLTPAIYITKDVDYHLSRLSTLHAEVTSTVSWSGVQHEGSGGGT